MVVKEDLFCLRLKEVIVYINDGKKKSNVHRKGLQFNEYKRD